MKNITAGTQVQAHTGDCIGVSIYETFYNGEIIKVNEKSIRVRLHNVRDTLNGKTTSERATNIAATFRFWKVLEDSGEVLYKNMDLGLIKI